MGTSSVVSTIPNFHSSIIIATSSKNAPDGGMSNAICGKVEVGRRGFLNGLIAVGVGGICGKAAVAEEMPIPEVGLLDGRLRGCDGRPPCVSTSAFRSPSRFMAPWTYLGSQEDSYDALKRALARMGAQIVKEDGQRYVYAVLQSSTSSKEDVDDLEFLFKGRETEEGWRSCETILVGCPWRLMKTKIGCRCCCIESASSNYTNTTIWVSYRIGNSLLKCARFAVTTNYRFTANYMLLQDTGIHSCIC
uniref:Uncharacterized protein n=1 Tax=Physcomitrium patens TaxID=3218 RepID=A9S7B5_PHYPA|nr:hypothetical protein PHYPA_009436 [Physcomitrium patens]